MIPTSLFSLMALFQDPAGIPPDPAAVAAVVPPPAVVTPSIEFPERALYRGVARGDVVVDCLVMESGVLTDCDVVSEEPLGFGFGTAGLQAARRARLSVVSADSVGSRLRFTIRFRLADDPEPEADARGNARQ
jgi:hypothetical protein